MPWARPRRAPSPPFPPASPSRRIWLRAASTSSPLGAPSRSTYPSGSSRSAAVGAMSGWPQAASRAAAPCLASMAANRLAASRSRRGRSSRPTSPANAFSAGPPVARRRRTASPRAAVCGRCSRVARSVDDVDPALDQGEVGLEPRQGGLLGRARVGPEQLVLQRLLQGRGVGRVDLLEGGLDALGVDGDVAGVVPHRGEQLRAPATARRRRGAPGRPRGRRGRGAPARGRPRGPRRRPRCSQAAGPPPGRRRAAGPSRCRSRSPGRGRRRPGRPAGRTSSRSSGPAGAPSRRAGPWGPCRRAGSPRAARLRPSARSGHAWRR